MELNLVLVVFRLIKSPTGTFDSTPPPVKYLTVKVVFEGAIP
jgi:hypothetical protein